jgi:hypothetical protein
MTYDPNIRSQRKQFLALVVVNLGFAAVAVYRSQWFISMAFIVWALNCLVMRQSLKATQKLQDESRLMQAILDRSLQN